MESFEIYAGKPNGSIDMCNESVWFGSSTRGCEPRERVLPLDAERMRPVTVLAAITTNSSNVAIAAAKVNKL